MKRLTNCMTTAAAVLMMTAGVVSAQTQMRAEVPFAFSAGGKVVEPGAYNVGLIRGSAVAMLRVSNTETRNSFLVVPKVGNDVPKKWTAIGTPRMAFDCSTGACVLARIWFGEGLAYDLHGPKTRSGETMLTEIVMKPEKAD